MKIIRIHAMWCSGCLVMKKVWKKIESIHNIEYIDYDYDMDEDIVKTFSPGSILPVTIFLLNDIEITRLNGEKTFDEINNIIESNK